MHGLVSNPVAPCFLQSSGWYLTLTGWRSGGRSWSVCIAIVEKREERRREKERRTEGWERGRGSVSHGAGCPEVGQELETQADHEVPDVARHLRSCDEDTPDQDHQDCVEGVADVSQPADTKTQRQTVRDDHLHFYKRSDNTANKKKQKRIFYFYYHKILRVCFYLYLKKKILPP